MTRAVLAMGSNLGDQEANLRKALEGLWTYTVTVSDGFWTAPWGDPDQPDYLNAVVIVEAEDATAEGWLEIAQRLEQEGGRVRDPDRQFGPRTLDVDVIAVWNDDGSQVVQDDPALTLPHPRAHLRAFVLVPWSEIQPDAELAGHGQVADLLKTDEVATDIPGVRRMGPLRS